MTQQIPLAQLPRQEFSIRLDNHRYTFRIIDVGTGTMGVTITRDDVTLLDNVRAVAGRPLIPYDYLTEFGNFAFATANDNQRLPWWEDFDITCRLIYEPAI